MPAHEVLHNHQFEMFMPAHKLFSAVDSVDTGGEPLSDDELEVERKLDESHSGSAKSVYQKVNANIKDIENLGPVVGSGTLYDSIKRHGVVKPVTLVGIDGDTKLILEDGHHRIVSAHDIDPNMEIPVNYRVWLPKGTPRS